MNIVSKELKIHYSFDDFSLILSDGDWDETPFEIQIEPEKGETTILKFNNVNELLEILVDFKQQLKTAIDLEK